MTDLPPLVLYNSWVRAKEPFAPLDPSRVGLYVCGPTVYDLAHIGNGRNVVVFDTLFRLLRRRFGAEHVRYVRNITDVDDKINAAAAAEGVPIGTITARTTEAFHADMAALSALPPDIEPRATDHIAIMIDMIERLIASGHAYAAQGHALFRVASLPDYGRLSGRSPDELLAGARVEVAAYKESPGDFVLWKPSSPDLPGWESPWGRGRPGWHIECSAMSEAHLGTTFDIHGGGLDLIFPHHENELAQSVCAHGGAPFARVWMHNEMLVVDGEKMSKSLGNFTTVREERQQWHGEVLRLALLSAHYRDTLDWTGARLAQNRQALERWYLALRPFAGVDVAIDPAVEAALADDLNTPQAITLLHEIATALNKAEEAAERRRLAGLLLGSARLLGVLGEAPEDWFRWRAPADASAGLDDAAVDRLIAERRAARARRDFAEADRLRKELTDGGILLEDGPAGTSWRRA